MNSIPNVKYSVLLAICLFCLAWYIFSGTWEENPGPDYEKDLLIMKQKNDSLETLSQALDAVNLRLANEADSLIRLLEDDKRRISELKRRKSEKIEIIDRYDGDELLLFFANLKTDSSKAER